MSGYWGGIVRAGELYGGKKKKPKRKQRRDVLFTTRTADLKREIRAAKEEFFASREWQTLRYQALRLNDGRCELCGRGKRDGVVLHVDHIKPRSRYPELAYQLTNLQVLCEDCNLGKGNKCTRDWRKVRETA